MEKQISSAFGKKQFLIGKDKNGINYWLQESSFDCGWYWSVGYIETFTVNDNPKISRDITSYQHFNSMMENTGKHHNEAFKTLFVESVLTDKEVWSFLEMMTSLYTLRSYSDLLHTGGAHISLNHSADVIKNEMEYKRVNEIVIPDILGKLYSLLTPKK